MDPSDTRNPPAPSRRGVWTPKRQTAFLGVLIDTGCVGHAAQAVGMSRSSAYRLRARLAGTPFVRDWDRALAIYTKRMADPLAPPPSAPPGGSR